MHEKQSLGEVHVDELLWQVHERGAHELRLEVGRPPLIRRDGEVNAYEMDYENAQQHQVQAMAYDLISDEQIVRFENNKVLLFEHWIWISQQNAIRFVVVVTHNAEGGITATFRRASSS
jgi:Tfp pilus assembly pilus retraction ATPase PilT